MKTYIDGLRAAREIAERGTQNAIRRNRRDERLSRCLSAWHERVLGALEEDRRFGALLLKYIDAAITEAEKDE